MEEEEEEGLQTVAALLGMGGLVEASCRNTGTGGRRPRTAEQGLLPAGRIGTFF